MTTLVHIWPASFNLVESSSVVNDSMNLTWLSSYICWDPVFEIFGKRRWKINVFCDFGVWIVHNSCIGIESYIIDGAFLFCFQLTFSFHVSLSYFDIDNNYLMLKSILLDHKIAVKWPFSNMIFHVCLSKTSKLTVWNILIFFSEEGFNLLRFLLERLPPT